jgi:hypothetical protein
MRQNQVPHHTLIGGFSLFSTSQFNRLRKLHLPLFEEHIRVFRDLSSEGRRREDEVGEHASKSNPRIWHHIQATDQQRSDAMGFQSMRSKDTMLAMIRLEEVDLLVLCQSAKESVRKVPTME